MNVLKVHGKDADGKLMPFVLINPVNVVVNVGSLKKPGHLKDSAGNPIMVTEEKTFMNIDGRPLIIEETVEEIHALAKEA